MILYVAGKSAKTCHTRRIIDEGALLTVSSIIHGRGVCLILGMGGLKQDLNHQSVDLCCLTKRK